MASITRQKNGRRVIQFVGADGKRRSIRLGKTPQKVAETVKLRVEMLNAASIAGDGPDSETARWLASLDQALHNKLAAVGLVPKRESVKLGTFLDSYIATRTDVKGPTAVAWGHTRRNLIDYFGADKALREITPGDADEWRLWLVNDQKLSKKGTVPKRSGNAKQFFTFAKRKGFIDLNPFADLKSAVQGGHQVILTRADRAGENDIRCVWVFFQPSQVFFYSGQCFSLAVVLDCEAV